MMGATRPCPQGLYGSGLVTDDLGEPLRPGGLALTMELLDRASFRFGDRVIDAGCGQGGSVTLMTRLGLRAIGIDDAPGAVAAARSRVGADAVILGQADALPIADGTVTGVLSECSLSAMPDRARALTEWVRVLEPGGCLLLSDVYARRPADAAAPARCGMAGRCALMAAAAAAGLVVEAVEDRSAVLRPWVARFVFRYGSLDALWGGACGLTADAARRAHPGYMLMVARKPVRAASGALDLGDAR